MVKGDVGGMSAWLGFAVGFSLGMGRGSERRAVDADGDAVVYEAVYKGVDEALSLKEVIPLGVIQV